MNISRLLQNILYLTQYDTVRVNINKRWKWKKVKCVSWERAENFHLSLSSAAAFREQARKSTLSFIRLAHFLLEFHSSFSLFYSRKKRFLFFLSLSLSQSALQVQEKLGASFELGRRRRMELQESGSKARRKSHFCFAFYSLTQSGAFIFSPPVCVWKYRRIRDDGGGFFSLITNGGSKKMAKVGKTISIDAPSVEKIT